MCTRLARIFCVIWLYIIWYCNCWMIKGRRDERHPAYFSSSLSQAKCCTVVFVLLHGPRGAACACVSIKRRPRYIHNSIIELTPLNSSTGVMCVFFFNSLSKGFNAYILSPERSVFAFPCGQFRTPNLQRVTFITIIISIVIQVT